MRVTHRPKVQSQIYYTEKVRRLTYRSTIFVQGTYSRGFDARQGSSLGELSSQSLDFISCSAGNEVI